MNWRRATKTLNWVLVGATIGSSACGVDDRQLSSARSPADMGGAGSTCSNANQICDDGDDAGTDAGTMGGSSSATTTCGSDLCPDLNHNNILDNTETLASNSTFSQDINDWDPEPGIGLGWSGDDACGRCNSGSMDVTNSFAGTSGDFAEFAMDGGRQCIVAVRNKLYSIVARANPAADSFGGVGLAFYASKDCTGDKIAYNTPLPSPCGRR